MSLSAYPFIPMKSSITQSKIKNLIRTSLSIVFWIAVWEIVSIVVNNKFLLPGIHSTFSELMVILSSPQSYKFMLLTLLRVVVGFIIGIFGGVVLGIAAHSSKLVYSLISPIITVIRSTPVASFIVILWVLFSGDVLSVFIAFLMVMPIIWQSTLDGFDAIDNNLDEVAKVFRFGFFKRFKLVVFPSLLKFLVPAIITAAGLAWKAEIAAEIIAYTKNSVGQQINDAKYFMDTPKVFAWTVIIVLFSILLEKVAKILLSRVKNEH